MEHITKEQMDALQGNSGLAVIDFYADWCVPCKNFGKVLESIESEYPGISFRKCNVEDEEGMAEDFDVRHLPTWIVLKDGREIFRQASALPAEKVRETLNAML